MVHIMVQEENQIFQEDNQHEGVQAYLEDNQLEIEKDIYHMRHILENNQVRIVRKKKTSMI